MWKIDRDYIDTGAVGTCSRSWDAKKSDQATQRFRMLDGDGNIYYGGRCTPELLDGSEELAFSPLDDFGMPNAGCVEIQFHERGEWRPL